MNDITLHTVSAGCVSLSLGHEPGAAECRALVLSALELKGLPPWHSMEISLFAGVGECLLIAVPSLSVAVADYALPFLKRRHFPQ